MVLVLRDQLSHATQACINLDDDKLFWSIADNSQTYTVYYTAVLPVNEPVRPKSTITS